MIAKIRGRYLVDLYADKTDVANGDALVTIHPDFFYDLFGSMAHDHLKHYGDVELECGIVAREEKPDD